MSELTLLNTLNNDLGTLTGWITVLALVGIAILHLFVSIPWLEKSATIINARLGKFARFINHNDLKKAYHASFATVWAMSIGAFLGIVRLFDTEIFDWYITEALTVWPNYGSTICWIINGGIAIFAIGLVCLNASIIRIHGIIISLALIPLMSIIAISCFWIGVIGGPVAFIAVFCTTGFSGAFLLPFKGTWLLIDRAAAPAKAL